MKTWSDDVFSHYMLVGERFPEQKLLLDLMLRYTGSCKLHQQEADMDVSCNLDCQNCPHSIYHEIELQRRAFFNRCKMMCHRIPTEGDEWEVNLVMRKGRIPKFQTFFWNCTKFLEEGEIIDIIFESIREYDETIFASAQLCYVKVFRRDMESPVDVSFVANEMLKQKAKEAGIGMGFK